MLTIIRTLNSSPGAVVAGVTSDAQYPALKARQASLRGRKRATEMFLRDNHHDSDFSAFMSVWFFEEQKHSLVLMEYLRRFKPELCPTEEELHAVRFEFDPAPPLETLMLHFCGEIRLNHWYRRAAEWHTEPVIKAIYETISRDEARHGGAYLRYMKKAMTQTGDIARAAFAKIGVLMASARRWRGWPAGLGNAPISTPRSASSLANQFRSFRESSFSWHRWLLRSKLRG